MIHKERNKFYPVESSWGYTRLKNIADYITRGNSPTYDSEGNIQVVNQACINGYEVSLEHIKVHKDDDISLLKGRLQRGDLLMNSTGTGTLGRTAIFNHEGDNFIADSHITIIRDSHKRFIPKYLHYYFNDKQEMLTERCSRGATNQIEIQRKELITLLVPFPLKVIQEGITAFLDKACAAIDGAIRTKQQQLEVLENLRKSIIHKAVTRGLSERAEFKESEVEWLGRIPQHWKVLPFKSVFKLIYRYPTYYDIDYVDGGIPEIRGEALGDDGTILKLDSERYIAPETNDQFPQTQLELGDIVMSVRGTMGKIGLVDKRYIGANITANLLRLSPKKGIASGHFVRWLFLSHYFAECLVATSPQTTIKTVTMPQLATIRLAIPPVPEQLQVSEYLEEEIRGIGDLKKNLTNQITVLEHYRKSLIHECVTGKRRIE